MNEPLILTFDVGTQSMRALLLDKGGAAHGSMQQVYDEPYYSRNPNWAEQRPDMYFEALCSLSSRLHTAYPNEFRRVIAVALTVFRDTVVCVDAEGKPLRDAILWMDQRRVRQPKPLPAAKKLMFAAVGMTDTIDMLTRTSICNWLAENEPKLWEKTDKYIMLSTYLCFRLTGRMADSVASMIGHIPFDYKNRVWDKNGLTRCLYDIPQDKLCELVPAGSVLGHIPEAVAAFSGIPAGLPLIATGSDKGCETLGLSVLHEDQAALSFGTSATVQFASHKYFEPTPFMPAYPAVPNELYNGEIQLLRGYWMLTWFKQNFAEVECVQAEKLGCSAEELLNRHLAEIPAGSDGLLVLPHWTPGLSTPSARGAMIGYSDVHTKYHVYRAIIEGINFGLMEGLYAMQKSSKQRIARLYAGGGGSRSDEILQITANMFGLPVHRIQTNEACALGAAMCAFVACGEFADYDEAVSAMVHIKDVFTPDMTEHTLYKQIYDEVFSKYYKTLYPLHRRLAALTRRAQR